MAGELHKGDGPRDMADARAGSFTFDEATMRSLISQWLDLADSYGESLANAGTMARVEAPGLDFASKAQAEAANRSGNSYIEYLASNRRFCAAQAQLFQDALDDYLGVEHTNVIEFDKTHPEV